MDLLVSSFKISKISKDIFRYTGVDIVSYSDRIEFNMEAYAKSLTKIPAFRTGKKDDQLTDVEMSHYRKYVGKISWLATNSRADLIYTANEMATKNHSATLGDLKRINKVIDWVHSRSSKVTYRKIGPRETLKV